MTQVIHIKCYVRIFFVSGLQWAGPPPKRAPAVGARFAFAARSGLYSFKLHHKQSKKHFLAGGCGILYVNSCS